MQVVIATGRPVGATVDRPSGPAVDPVAALGGDAAELLDVQVDQVAWLVMLVAADRAAGRAVHEGQPVHPVADQHLMDGRGGHTEAGGDAGRAEPLAAAQPEDALLQAGGGPPRTPQGDAGPSTRPAWPSCW
jgi:hypothetical protein